MRWKIYNIVVFTIIIELPTRITYYITYYINFITFPINIIVA